MIPVDDKHEQMYEWDKQSGQWKETRQTALDLQSQPRCQRRYEAGKRRRRKNGHYRCRDGWGVSEERHQCATTSPCSERMEENVDTVFSGTAANFATDMGNLATTLGVASPDLVRKVGNSEQAIADVAELVRSKIKALGSGSAISNTDLLFTNRSMPDLLKTPSGRKMIISAMKADIQNISGDHQAARQWFDSHNQSLADLSRRLQMQSRWIWVQSTIAPSQTHEGADCGRL